MNREQRRFVLNRLSKKNRQCYLAMAAERDYISHANEDMRKRYMDTVIKVQSPELKRIAYFLNHPKIETWFDAFAVWCASKGMMFIPVLASAVIMRPIKKVQNFILHFGFNAKVKRDELGFFMDIKRFGHIIDQSVWPSCDYK